LRRGTIVFFIPSAETDLRTGCGDVLQSELGAESDPSSKGCERYQVTLATGRLHRCQTDKSDYADPVETVVKKMNVRYSRGNKNNKNLSKDSFY
jgi:hypothetical protein